MQPNMAGLKTALNACFRPSKRALGPRQPYLGAKLLLFREICKFFCGKMKKKGQKEALNSKNQGGIESRESGDLHT